MGTVGAAVVARDRRAHDVQQLPRRQVVAARDDARSTDRKLAADAELAVNLDADARTARRIQDVVQADVARDEAAAALLVARRDDHVGGQRANVAPVPNERVRVDVRNLEDGGARHECAVQGDGRRPVSVVDLVNRRQQRLGQALDDAVAHAAGGHRCQGPLEIGKRRFRRGLRRRPPVTMEQRKDLPDAAHPADAVKRVGANVGGCVIVLLNVSRCQLERNKLGHCFRFT